MTVRNKDYLISIDRGLMYFLLLPLIGCMSQTPPKNPHHSPIPIGTASIAKPELEILIPKSQKKKITNPSDLKRYLDNEAEIKILKLPELLDKFVRPLQKILFHTENLGQPQVQGKKHYRELWRIFFQAMLQSYLLSSHSGNPNAELKKIEKILVKNLLLGCNEYLQDCQVIPFFRNLRDPQLSQILVAVSKSIGPEDLMVAYQILRLAYDLKGDSELYELDLIYLKYSLDYSDLLNTRQNLQLFESHIHTLQTILHHSNFYDSKPEFDEFLRSFPLFSHDKLSPYTRRLVQSINSLIVHHITKKAAFLYDKNNELLPNLKEAIQVEEASESGYSFAQNFIRSHSQADGLLQSDKMGQLDEYFYLVSQVFTEKTSPEVAAKIYETSMQNNSRLLEVVNYYIRTHFVKTVIQSHKLLAKFLLEPKPSQSILKDVFEQKSGIDSLWTHFYRNSGLVREFGRMVFSSGKGGFFQDFIRLETELFLRLRSNVKTLVVYPHMVMLAYHLFQIGFKEKRKSFIFGTVEITPADILQKIFTGKQEPLFFYGTDELILNSIQVLFSLSISQHFGLLETFSIEPKLFFRTLGDLFLQEYLADLRDINQTIMRRYKSNTITERFKQLCNLYLKKDKLPEDLHLLELEELSENPLLGSLRDKFYTQSAHETNYGVGLFTAWIDPALHNVLDYIRTEVKPRKQYLEFLLQTYQSVYPTDATSTHWLKEAFQPVDDEMNLFFTQLVSLLEVLDVCFLELAQFERTIEVEILKRESLYLRQVHQDMTNLRSGVLKPDDIVEKYRFKECGQYTGFDSFDENNFLTYRLDFLMRIKKYLERDTEIDGHSLPPLAPFISVQTPKGDSWYEEAVFRNKVFETISYSTSIEEFVSKGIKVILGQENSVRTKDRRFGYQWLKGGPIGVASSSAHQFVIQSSLSRLGDLTVYESLSCLLEEPRRECPKKKYQYDLKKIMKSVRQTLGFFHIQDSEAPYLEMASINSKLKSVTNRYEQLFFNGQTREPLGFYDLLYYIVKSPLLGTVTEFPPLASELSDGGMAAKSNCIGDYGTKRHLGHCRVDFFTLSKFYYLAREELKYYLLPLPQSYLKSTDQYFKTLVRTEIEFVRRLEQLIEQEEKDKTLPPLILRLFLDEPTRTGPYLTPALLDSQRSIYEEFHKETSGMFRSAEF